MRYLSNSITGCVLVSLSLMLFSCGGKTTDVSQKDNQVSPVSCVVVLPTLTPYKDSNEATNSNNLEAGVKFLDTSIPRELQNSKVMKVLESTQFRPAITEMSEGTQGYMKEIGEEADCKNLFITTLSKFRQRQGGEMAVNVPAAAAFEMRLVESDSGRTLWASTFNETQSSLMENLFSFGRAQSRGFKWITVEELASQGVQEKLQECPYFY